MAKGSKNDQGASRTLKQAAAVLGALALLVVSGWLAVRSLATAPQENAAPAPQTFYYDTQTGVLFVAPATRNLPIPVPGAADGAPPTGVIASVFSCTSCSDEKSRQPYLLETKDPAGGPDATIIAAIRKPKTPVSDLKWVSSTSPVAAEIEEEGLKDRCPGKARPHFCKP